MNAPAREIPYPANRVACDDEIDLLELMAVIWQGRWLLLAAVAASAALAWIYISSATKIYQIDASIYAVSDIQLAPVSPGFSPAKENYDIGRLEAQPLYRKALNNLQSRSTIAAFLAQSDRSYSGFFAAADSETKQVNRFVNSLSVNRDKDSPLTHISLDSRDSAAGAALLHDYLNYVSHATVASAAGDLVAAINNHISYIDRSATVLRQQTQTQLNDRMAHLSEAIQIARTLDMEEAAVNKLADRESALPNDRLYLLGTRALEAELQALGQRRQNDAFIPQLRQLQSARQALQIDAEKIQQNVPATGALVLPPSLHAPAAHTSPKTLLIMLAAVAAGAIFGLCAVFIRQGMRTYHKRRQHSRVNENTNTPLPRHGEYRAA